MPFETYGENVAAKFGVSRKELYFRSGVICSIFDVELIGEAFGHVKSKFRAFRSTIVDESLFLLG